MLKESMHKEQSDSPTIVERNGLSLVMLRTGLWLKVDASRRRNDPRKATCGRRAWCGLDVSPAVPQADWRFGCEKENVRGHSVAGLSSITANTVLCYFLSRRVWGQRPGQPYATNLLIETNH